MGSLIKKLGRISNKGNPHTWVMGEKASANIDLAGQLVGAHDARYQPQNVDAPPAPSDAGALIERDRMRRRVAKAMGQPSTIKAGSLAQPYTGAPARLLGG